jgi:hypothetical protein
VAVGAALGDGGLHEVGHRLQADGPRGPPGVRGHEFLRDDAEVRPRAYRHAEGEVAGAAAHGGDEVPAARRAGVDAQVPAQLRPELLGRLVPERRRLAGKRQVVVDGLRHVRHAQLALRRLRHPECRRRGVVAPDGDEVRDAEGGQRPGDLGEVLRLLRRVGPAREEDAPPRRLDAGDVGVREGTAVGQLPLHETRVAAGDPHDLPAAAARGQGHGVDHPVEARGGTAAVEDADAPHGHGAGGPAGGHGGRESRGEDEVDGTWPRNPHHPGPPRAHRQ